MTMPDVRKGTNPYSYNHTKDKPNPFPVTFYLGQTSVDGDTTINETFNGLAIYYDGSAAATLTFPANLLPGFNCMIIQGGTGQISIVADTGATMNNRQSFTKTAGQYAMMGVVHRSDGTFYLGGDGAT